MSAPKISVAMITYGHERFIAQAIESVLSQEIDAPFELVIGEDCSKDGTRRVVEEYAARFPDIIRPLLPKTNLGMQRNFGAVLEACKGEYVALLEGDDYWLSPEKLARQAAVLDAHDGISLCYHNGYYCAEQGGAFQLGRPLLDEPPPPMIGVPEVLSGAHIPTCSVMLRRSCLVIPPEFYASPFGDRFVQIMAALRGELIYLDEHWGAYRIHGGGVYSALDVTGKLEQNLRYLDLVESYLKGQYADELRKVRFVSHYRAALQPEQPARRGVHHLLQCARTGPAPIEVDYERLGKAALWHGLRPAYRAYRSLRARG